MTGAGGVAVPPAPPCAPEGTARVTSSASCGSYSCPAITWVALPPGCLMMGSDERASSRPIHRVELEGFEISQTEVTVGQYRSCVEAGACSSSFLAYPDCLWTDAPMGYEDRPINCLDWPGARAFAEWASATLPSEAQWEYAARAGEPFRYAGSDDPYAVAWFDATSRDERPEPVALKPPNAFGLYDMSGNVMEWLLDEYRDTYEGAPADGAPACANFCAGSPSAERVARGGAWDFPPSHAEVSARMYFFPDTVQGTLGLRVARAPR